MSMHLLAVYTGKQFKHKGHIPEHIRNQTVPIVVGNGLNFLSNNEQHGLLGIPLWGETYGENTRLSTPYLKDNFPVIFYSVLQCSTAFKVVVHVAALPPNIITAFFRKFAFEMQCAMSSRDEIIQSDFFLLLPPPLIT